MSNYKERTEITMNEFETNKLTVDQLKKRHVKVLSYYDILENEEGDILFTIRHESARTDTHNPQFYYDGGDHAIFIKDDGHAMVCDFIHPGVRGSVGKIVRKGGKILFAELKDGKIVDEYMAETIWCENVAEIAEEFVKR